MRVLAQFLLALAFVAVELYFAHAAPPSDSLPVQILPVAGNRVTFEDVTFSPDGTRILADTESGILLWDAVTGKPVRF